MYKNNSRSIHFVVSTHTHTLHIYTATQSCKHTHICDKVNFVIRLLVLEEVLLHMLHSPPPVNYATRWSTCNIYCFVLRKRINTLGSIGWRRCMVEKASPFCTWSTHSVVMAACWLACKAHQIHLMIRQVREREREKEREREGKQMHTWHVTCSSTHCSISLVTYHCMASKNDEHSMWTLTALL